MKIQNIWKIETGLSSPESCYYDEGSQHLFVSNIVGQPMDKDAQGYISIYSADGKLKKLKWVDGLDAPKGMRASGNTLWVSNINELISIDIKTAKIISRIQIPDSKFLNDIAIDKNSNVYVSDTTGGKIYKITNGKISVLIEGEKADGPNGLLILEDDLIVAAWGRPEADWSTKTPGHLYKINLRTKSKSNITSALGNLDGLEMDSRGNFIVSDWVAGKVFWVSPAGKSELILKGIKNSADIGYIPSTNILVVPSMGDSKVFAYKLNSN
ncbi:MAG: hypothetical protein COV44_07635 [Deltaproteobacteria bacterium CG11_big_fil_rev_8_21_14_0_20_45_16]|nr:MAG: hypothetical protein COV44_07635 [Deltaproteobacteria bacterium CG11_big_fil_rev_8_21_14_0_20_45_16]